MALYERVRSCRTPSGRLVIQSLMRDCLAMGALFGVQMLVVGNGGDAHQRPSIVIGWRAAATVTLTSSTSRMADAPCCSPRRPHSEQTPEHRFLGLRCQPGNFSKDFAVLKPIFRLERDSEGSG